MSINVVYAPPNVRVTGEDIFESNMGWLAKFAPGGPGQINERLKSFGYNQTKQKHFPIGYNFNYERCQIHVVPTGAEVIDIQTEPVYQVLRRMENNAPQYLDEVGLYVVAEEQNPQPIPENWAKYEDQWWRPARRGENAKELSFRVLNTTEQQFNASASHSVTHESHRDTSNAFSAGIATTVGVEVGAEGGGFSAKVSTSTTVSFDYTRTESSGQSVSEQISTSSGLTISLLPGEHRQTVFNAKKGIARFRVRENAFYKGLIGINWDHDVDFVSGGKGRQLYVNAGQALGLDGINVEEIYRVQHYSDGVIALEDA